MEDLVALLKKAGQNSSHVKVKEVPACIQDALQSLTDGYDMDLSALTKDSVMPTETTDMIVMRDVPFTSLCAHHLLPFSGTVTIGYVPDESMIGFGTIPKIVRMFAHRLQMQERLGQDICKALEEVLKPKGVAILITASHQCMHAKDTTTKQTTVSTIATRGCIQEEETKNTFLMMAKD